LTHIGKRLLTVLTGAFALLLAPADIALAKDGPAPSAPEVVRLWPGAPPGGTLAKSPERTFTEQADWKQQLVTISVSDPTMTVVRPKAGTANGTAMVVAPGGGFISLVWDLEGTEVADWLAARGITAFILKYRVSLPGAAEAGATDTGQRLALMEPRRKMAVADALQAISLVRQNAARWGIDRKRVGMMGFSAGAMTTMGAVLADDPAQRPDFAAPIYGAAPGAVAAPDSPALFIAHAQDDPLVPAVSSTAIFDAWQAAKRPAELHIYAQGGHGFGMRAQGLPVDRWPSDFEAWLGSRGLITIAKPVPAVVSTTRAPATNKGSEPLSTTTTAVGVLIGNPAARAIIDQHIPGLTESGTIAAARSLTLKEIQAYAPDLVTDARLARIDADLRKLARAQ
jgi:acetyl esterase/lipase